MESIILSVCLLLLLFFLLRFVYYRQLKIEFKRQYKIDFFPKKVKIHRKILQTKENCYTLGFPRWSYANKDGTRDRRRNNNEIYYPGCDLYVDQFHVVINNPRLMIRLVNSLRQHNAKIEKNKYEIEKENRVLREKERDHALGDLNDFINRFKDNPYEFENFCARLYHLMGIDSEKTANSNDGGYDIILYYKNGERGLVECKCYNTSKIGRPLVQKLVGANQIIGAKHLIFITTSDFSEAAKEYAKQTGVELIDGVMLMNMIDYYIRPEQIKVTVSEDEWLLCDEDIKKYIPEDIYSEL